MRIVVDQDIPYLQSLEDNPDIFCERLPAAAITQQNIVNADALFIRTITPVNAELLNNTAVKFVACPSSGIDHIDTNYLEQAGITWAHAPGCNSSAVTEYLISCLAYLYKQKILLEKTTLRAGIIGVGHVGTKVAAFLKLIGFEVLLNDPPRAAVDPSFHSTPLKQFKDLDLISLHCSLTTSGKYPSYQLLDQQFLEQQNPGCILINTARGEIITDATVASAPASINFCFDVWPGEPNIDLATLQHTIISTPHIAGYSKQSKYAGSQEICEQFLQHFNMDNVIATPPLTTKSYSIEGKKLSWQDIVLAIYDPLLETQIMRQTLLRNSDAVASNLQKMRNNYELRQSFANCIIDADICPEGVEIVKNLFPLQ